MYSTIKRMYSVAVKGPAWDCGAYGFVRSRRGTRPPAAAGTRAAGPVRAGTRPPHPVLAQPDLPDRARAVRPVGRHALRPGHRTAHLARLPVQHRGARERPDDDRAR